jgi:hypothetical protein
MRDASSTTRPSWPPVEPTFRLRVRVSWWASPTVFTFRLKVLVVTLAMTELVLAVKHRLGAPTSVG